MIATWIQCSPGVYTKVFQGPALFGFVYLWTTVVPINVSYRIYSSGIPFYFQNTMDLTNAQTTIVCGPSPYIELYVNPNNAVTANFRGT
jgi:hypothetical protein